MAEHLYCASGGGATSLSPVPFKDLSHLPTPAAEKPEGVPPDPTPRFGHLLAQRWRDEDVPLARAHPDARFRHSDAGNCARAVAYAALDVPASNPMDLAGFWVTNMGRQLHELFQDDLEARYGKSVEVEVKVHDGERAGHVDAVVSMAQWDADDPTNPDGTRKLTPYIISIEYKSCGGYKYKLAVGERGAPEGPSYQHILQAALNAKALDADECVIVYLARDVISIQAAGRKPHLNELSRFCAEWTFTREQYEPIAQREIERVEAILAMVDDGMLPARKIPDPEIPARAIIISPRDGAWVEYDTEGHAVNSGSHWACPYCRWQGMCATTKPGRIPITDLPVEVTSRGDSPEVDG